MNAPASLAAATLLVFANSAFGTFVIATDNAGDPAYAGGAHGAWSGLNPTTDENAAGSDNGGVGFEPWDFAGGFHDGGFSPYGQTNHFIDGVDFPSSTFNDLGGPSFALTNSNQAFFGYTARATRVFAQPLTPGSTLSLSFDNPVLDPLANSDTAGIIIRLNSGGGPRTAANPNVSERLGFFAQDGFRQGDWHVTDSTGATSTDVPNANTISGAQLRITLTDAETYELELLTLDGSTSLYATAGTLTGQPGTQIDALELLIFGNGSGNGLTGTLGEATGERELFFNDLLITSPLSLLPGDYNNDGTVDAADYSVWRDNLGQPPETLLNDTDGGDIGSLQYQTWRVNYGNTRDPVGLGTIAVPEPATAALFAFCWMMLVSARTIR